MRNEPLRLRVLRAAHEPRLSQNRVARKARLARYRYWQIENGDGPEPSQAERQAVATALDVKVADIAWPAFATEQAS